MTTYWVQFQRGDETGFGTLDQDMITCYTGDLFAEHKASGETLALADVQLLAPCKPSKIVAMWNNFHQLAHAQGWELPEFPFYFLKPASCLNGPDAEIPHPSGYEGRIIYEGELGVVIGKRCKDVSVEQAAEYVLGYTCINDVTAIHLLFKYDAFPQWTRSKSFDGFGIVGPCIATLEDPSDLVVQTFVNGEERQNYPVSDMVFSPLELVSKISGDMTLEPGDIIACGTSMGVKTLKPDSTVDVTIAGIGTLRNRYMPDKQGQVKR